jgi:putative CocE/NonD family hydrolase
MSMSFTVDKDVSVTMRDGTALATDVWRPVGQGPWPTLLQRNPYGKDLPAMLGYGLAPNLFALLAAGYAVVFQDCRGTFKSGGQFTPMVNEPSDGADTLAWLLTQPWCDGNIGTYGPSYLGFVQWASASAGAEGLKAMAPAVTTTDYYTAPWYSDGGAMSLHTVHSWTIAMALADAQRAVTAGTGDARELMGLAAMMADPAPHIERFPVREQPLREKHWPWWSDILDHPGRDAFWREISVAEDYAAITVPALHLGGWYDIFVNNTLKTYTALRRQAGTPEAREGQRLVVGPWDHLTAMGVYPDRRFGLAADSMTCDLAGLHQKFYDRWLRGRQDALDDVAPVRIFVMGVDEWRDEQDWPLPDTAYTDYFLSGSGPANTAAGGGALTTAPSESARRDTYLYDPRRPVPTLGGRIMLPAAANAAGPVDQRPVEGRDDVLCYTTPPLTEPVEVTGHVSLVLHVASSALDTDFTGKLVDVFPDGRAILLCEGVIRARYRDSLERAEPLVPGEVYEVTLDLAATSNVFRPGHRIRLEVSSSNFPRYDRNTNTGGVISEDGEQDLVVAVNHVLHGPAQPSRLVLPIIAR